MGKTDTKRLRYKEKINEDRKAVEVERLAYEVLLKLGAEGVLRHEDLEITAVSSEEDNDFEGGYKRSVTIKHRNRVVLDVHASEAFFDIGPEEDSYDITRQRVLVYKSGQWEDILRKLASGKSL